MLNGWKAQPSKFKQQSHMLYIEAAIRSECRAAADKLQLSVGDNRERSSGLTERRSFVRVTAQHDKAEHLPAF